MNEPVSRAVGRVGRFTIMKDDGGDYWVANSLAIPVVVKIKTAEEAQWYAEEAGWNYLNEEEPRSCSLNPSI